MLFGEDPDRRPIRRVFGLQLELVVELLDHVADGQPGIDHALRHALAPLRDRGVDIGREVVVAAKPVLIIRDGGEAPAALPAGDGRKVVMKAVEMVHREGFDEPQNVGLKTAQRVPRGIIEHVVGEPVGRAQPVARDGAKRGEVLLGGGFLGLEMGAR